MSICPSFDFQILGRCFLKEKVKRANCNSAVWTLQAACRPESAFFGCQKNEHTGRVWCLLYPIGGISTSPWQRGDSTPNVLPGCAQAMLCQRLYRFTIIQRWEQDVWCLSKSTSNLCKYQARKEKARESCYSQCCCGSHWERYSRNASCWTRCSAHYLGNFWRTISSSMLFDIQWCSIFSAWQICFIRDLTQYFIMSDWLSYIAWTCKF